MLQLVRRRLRRLLHGSVVRERHVHKNCMPRLAFDIDIHSQHICDCPKTLVQAIGFWMVGGNSAVTCLATPQDRLN